MKGYAFYLKKSYIGLAISLTALLLLMAPKYEFNFSYNNLDKDVRIITYSDISQSPNLRSLDAKYGDYIIGKKLKGVAEHFNVKDTFIAFSLIIAAYLCSIGVMNFVKVILGFGVHWILVIIPLLIFQDISIQNSFIAFSFYAIWFFTATAIIYYIFFLMIPYFYGAYSNSLLGLYIKAKKNKIRKQIEKELDEDK